MSKKYREDITWQKIIQFGLISGVAIVYVCLVGMVETFHERDVIFEYLSLGRTLLVVISFGIGYIIAGRVVSNPGKALGGSVVAGLLSMVVTTILILLIEPLNMREMFVNASNALIQILTFEQESLTTGLLMLGALLVGFHFVGAAVYLLPTHLRRFITVGLSAVVVMGMLQELLEVVLARSDITEPIGDFLFARSGLSVQGAVAVFIIFGLLNFIWVTQGSNVNQSIAKLPPAQQRVFSWGTIGLSLLFLFFLPQMVGPYISQILVLVGLYVLMGLGLNIEIGLAGLLDLGFVGFFAIGAYTVALFTSPTEVGLASVVAGEATNASFASFWVAIPVAVAISAMAGVFLGIPVLRMRGDYLAIVTLGLAEIIRILVLSDFLRPLLGGAQGVLNIPKPNVSDIPVLGWFADWPVKDPGDFYYLIIIGCMIIAFIAWRLQNARIGRNWMAIREDEDVAEAMGINLILSKLLAFGTGAAFAGLAGAIFAAQVGSVFPHSFGLIVSINVVSLVIIGGMGSIPGVVIGAFALVGLPELLREFSEFRLLIYGMLLVVMMLVKPEGFWPSEVNRRELAESVEEVRGGSPAAVPASK